MLVHKTPCENLKIRCLSEWMVKKKNPKEIIESTDRPDVEHSFIKYPGEEPTDITRHVKSSPFATENIIPKTNRIRDEHQNRPYSHIHTHPTFLPKLTEAQKKELKKGGLTENILNKFSEIYALPSPHDLRSLVIDDDMKTMVIAARNPDTGEVIGYQIIRKTKRSPKFGLSRKGFDKNPFKTALKIINANHFNFGRSNKSLIRDVNRYGREVKDSMKSGNYTQATRAFDELTSKYHLRHKMVSAKNYEPNESRTAFVRRSELESAAAAVSIIFLSVAFLFFSQNFTAEVIGYHTGTTPNFMGAVFFICGSIGAFIYLKKKQ